MCSPRSSTAPPRRSARRAARWPAATRSATPSRNTGSRSSARLIPGALDLARAGVETGGAAHNRRFVAPAAEIDAAVPAELVALAHDPQTSGGLLAAIPPDRWEVVRGALDIAGVEHWVVGCVED